MNEFYNQYFCPENNSISLIIDDDGRVAYAYLLDKDEIIADVWLYNSQETPETVDWNDKESMPFLNPKEFIKSKIEPINCEEDIEMSWFYEDSIREVRIWIRKQMIASLKPKAFPGWSAIVKKDGPLAKQLYPQIS